MAQVKSLARQPRPDFVHLDLALLTDIEQTTRHGEPSRVSELARAVPALSDDADPRWPYNPKEKAQLYNLE